MLGTLIAFWRAHKCRSRIVATLEPFHVVWRRNGGTDRDLGTPAALGFLATLIAARAQREAGPMDSDALGDLQTAVWHALTGQPADDLGERLVALSVSGDAAFARGCRAALVFDAALSALHDAGPDGLGSTPPSDAMAALPADLDGQADLAALWHRSLRGDFTTLCREFPDADLGNF